MNRVEREGKSNEGVCGRSVEGGWGGRRGMGAWGRGVERGIHAVDVRD